MKVNEFKVENCKSEVVKAKGGFARLITFDKALAPIQIHPSYRGRGPKKIRGEKQARKLQRQKKLQKFNYQKILNHHIFPFKMSMSI